MKDCATTGEQIISFKGSCHTWKYQILKWQCPSAEVASFAIHRDFFFQVYSYKVPVTFAADDISVVFLPFIEMIYIKCQELFSMKNNWKKNQHVVCYKFYLVLKGICMYQPKIFCWFRSAFHCHIFLCWQKRRALEVTLSCKYKHVYTLYNKLFMFSFY